MTLTVDDILDFSLDNLYDLFEKEPVVLSESLISALERYIDYFDLPVNENSKLLFRPIYWVFITKYADSFIEMDRNGNGINFWILRNGGFPSIGEFKNQIMLGYKNGEREVSGYKEYLEKNLELALQSSS